MRNFNQGGSNRGGGRPSGGRGSFGGGRSGGRSFGGGGRDRERPQMHSAVCADCGNRCEVPFKPTGDKPVYCSDCFGGNDRSGGRDFDRRDSRGGGRSFDRRDSRGGGRDFGGERRMYSAVCEACGDSCEVPFKPTGEKPVYCSSCFAGEEKTSSPKKPSVSAEAIEQLNAKLDKIITLLQRTNSVKEVTVMKAKKEEEADTEPTDEAEKPAKKKATTKKTEPKKPAAKKATKKATPAKKTATKKAAAKKK